MPVPVGAVTVMVPVDTVQLGCIKTTVGVEGVGAWVFITTFAEGAELHPIALVTV